MVSSMKSYDTDYRRYAHNALNSTALGVSLPQLVGRLDDTKAADNLFNHPEATPDTVQAGHRALVLDALQESGYYLLLEDTTEFDWTGRQPLPGLGPIGNSNTTTQGVLLPKT
jgi:hypothetical protein